MDLIEQVVLLIVTVTSTDWPLSSDQVKSAPSIVITVPPVTLPLDGRTCNDKLLVTVANLMRRRHHVIALGLTLSTTGGGA